MEEHNYDVVEPFTARIEADTERCLSAITELLGVYETQPALLKEFLQIVERLGGVSKLFCVNSDSRVAGRTSLTVVHFEPSEPLLNFLATVRTINRDLQVVEHTRVSCAAEAEPVLRKDLAEAILCFVERNPERFRQALGL